MLNEVGGQKIASLFKSSLFHEFPSSDYPYCNYAQIMTFQCFINYWKHGHSTNKKQWSLYFLRNLHYIESYDESSFDFPFRLLSSIYVIYPKARERYHVLRSTAIYPVSHGPCAMWCDCGTPWEKARDRAWKSPIFKSCLRISHHYFHVRWTQFPISWNAPRPELGVWFLFLLDLTRKIPQMFPHFQPTGTF